MEWARVAVVGAGGKMGRGIALLFLQDLALAPEGQRLILVDVDEACFLDLRQYLRKGLVGFAEKQINKLRTLYFENETLVSNKEMIDEFVENALDRTTIGCMVGEIQGANLVIEAIIEDPVIKGEWLQQAKALAHPDALFLSNTSSIPIQTLATSGGLEGRLIGFHFYNPPLVQKLVEVVASEELFPQAKVLADRLGKTIVRSQDIAGFIGNGHFIREVAYAWDLAQEHGFNVIEKVTGELLVRPMGIFSLVKFVGVDVCRHIAKMVDSNLERPLELPETLPKMGSKWKELQQQPDPTASIQEHFRALSRTQTKEAEIAIEFLKTSSTIASQLVKDGVADSLKDVGQVLKLGFHHLYLPWEVQ